jgi:Fur family peroxide stress response transcriptional regulator
MNLALVEEKLRSKKLKITPQRLEVLRTVLKMHHHPSADQIYRAVKKRHPAVSIATVYKTLETLVEIGEVRVALVSQGKARYDSRLDRHHHFLCSACGYVEDLEMKLDCLETCSPKWFQDRFTIQRSEVIFHGLCAKCAGKH